MNRLLIVVVLLSATALTGCRSRLTGNEGNLEFSYVADDDIRNFNKPIAVGAKLDVEVHTVGERRAVNLAEATSDAPGVLEVVHFQGNSITIEGRGDGQALLSVATADAEPVTDSVNMLARVPEVMKFLLQCDGSDNGRYLAGQTIWLGYDLEMTNGQPVIGYGYFPITVSPATGLTLDTASKNQQYFEFATDAVGSYTVASQIDYSSTALEVVAVGDIDGAEIGPGATNAEVGEKHLYNVRPTVAGQPVCQALTPFTVEVITADTCTVRLLGDGAAGTEPWQRSAVEIEGLQVGTCTFEAIFPQANGGNGVTVQLSVTVDP